MIDKAPLIAAIDVGTNSFHLIIASVNNRGMLQIHSREKEVVRLGSSGGDMKYLMPDAIERGVQTLSHFNEIARCDNAEIRAVATSAVREAENKDEFLRKVKEKTGIDIEVISGTEEGRLIYLGSSYGLPIMSKRALLIDIGGGSTESVIGYNSELVYVNSAKLGCIRLSKKFFPDDNTTKEQIKLCREYINGEWAPAMRQINEKGFDIAVATSGTIINIAMMALSAQKAVVPDMLNGITVDTEDIIKIINKIVKAKTTKERQAIPGMDPQRADIILAGALILEHALIELNIRNITISSYSLREGIVFDTIQKRQAIQEYKTLSHLRYETVRGLCQHYEVDLEHAEHVKAISLQLFDALIPLHRFGYAERELLEAAALLHDVGYHISHDLHHKHSYYIIMHCIMPGFSNNEAEIIANIARYHRKSHPSKKHENFESLSFSNKQVVRVLAGILRIAEGLDRRKQHFINNIKVKIENENIDIYLIPHSKQDNTDIELWGAERRKLLLIEALQRNISIYRL